MPRYPGGLIRKTPVTPAGPLQNGAAPGMWTLGEASYWVKQGLWPIAGNFLAVEDVFSTYLYTGNGSSQTISNGLNLSANGGLIWFKNRSLGATDHILVTKETNRYYSSSSIGTVGNNSALSFQWNTSGYGFTNSSDPLNASGSNYASWAFREAPKFFDIVTFTGNETNRDIPHNLGVTPGCIIIRPASSVNSWFVQHRSMGVNDYMLLDTTAAKAATANLWDTALNTSTTFRVGTNANINGNGVGYVAYLFAHDATADGIIQCGSYTGNGNASVQSINLGWEPQWILLKQSVVAGGSAGTTDAWQIVDNMRGLSVGLDDAILCPNNSNAENTNAFAMIAEPTATGWTVGSQANYSGATYIYIAIRRGPMKTPTVGTSVFSVNAGVNNTAEDGSITTLKNDLYIYRPYRTATTAPSWLWADRLRGYPAAGAPIINSSTTDAEATRTTAPYIYGNGTAAQIFSPAAGNLVYRMARAPGFFDVVCYTGTGVAQSVNHNLGVAPELIIHKSRSADVNSGWPCYVAPLGPSQVVRLNRTDETGGSSGWNDQTPTATQFFVKGYNDSGVTYVAYLFASCPGVSKVGSYVGNGSSQTINCGFSGGARFFLVKRTDSTGDWWVWDSARGITAPADPALRLNSTAAEVTSADATDPDNSGIIVNQESTCNINVNGATYIFLAVA